MGDPPGHSTTLLPAALEPVDVASCCPVYHALVARVRTEDGASDDASVGPVGADNAGDAIERGVGTLESLSVGDLVRLRAELDAMRYLALIRQKAALQQVVLIDAQPTAVAATDAAAASQAGTHQRTAAGSVSRVPKGPQPRPRPSHVRPLCVVATRRLSARQQSQGAGPAVDTNLAWLLRRDTEEGEGEDDDDDFVDRASGGGGEGDADHGHGANGNLGVDERTGNDSYDGSPCAGDAADSGNDTTVGGSAATADRSAATMVPGWSLSQAVLSSDRVAAPAADHGGVPGKLRVSNKVARSKRARLGGPSAAWGAGRGPDAQETVSEYRADDEASSGNEGARYCQQVQSAMAPEHPFWRAIEPYFEPVTMADVSRTMRRIQRDEADDAEYFDIPPLGQHFAEQWASEDLAEEAGGSAAAVADRSGPAGTNGLPTHGNADDGDMVLLSNGRCGTLTQRIMAALVDCNMVKHNAEAARENADERSVNDGDADVQTASSTVIESKAGAGPDPGSLAVAANPGKTDKDSSADGLVGPAHGQGTLAAFDSVAEPVQPLTRIDFLRLEARLKRELLLMGIVEEADVRSQPQPRTPSCDVRVGRYARCADH